MAETRAKRSIVDFDYAVQEGIASALGGVQEAVIQKDEELDETVSYTFRKILQKQHIQGKMGTIV